MDTEYTLSGKHAFGPLLAPLVGEGISTLSACSEFKDNQLLSASARQDIADRLFTLLATLCQLPFYRLLDEWRAAGSQSIRTLQFEDFHNFMRNHGYQQLFARYPTLLRLIALTYRQWQGETSEFLVRLSADRSLLDRISPFVGRGSILTGITYGLSDPHAEGRSVIQATFDNHHHVLYKPKSLLPDLMVAEILRLLAANDYSYHLLLPKSLARPAYGWVEYIDAVECSTPQEVSVFYRRTGAWLGLLHLLGATDLHVENIIASGPYPIPIDLETILQGLPRREDTPGSKSKALWAANSLLLRSVLAVGILPGYVTYADQTVLSVGGLEPTDVVIKSIAWEHLNLVHMRPYLVSRRRYFDRNTPRLNGTTISYKAYRDDICVGFRDTLEFAATIRSDLKACVEQEAASLTVRRVFRPTRLYHLLLQRLKDHRSMDDSVSWSMQAEAITRFYNWDVSVEALWTLVAAERLGLLSLSIPAFHMSATGHNCETTETSAVRLNVDSGVHVVVGRIESLSEDMISEQEDIIRAALQMPKLLAKDAVPSRGDTGRAGRESFVQADLAEATYRHLCSRAILEDDGSAAWLTLEYVHRELSAQIVPMGVDFYSGTCGVALFFAAFAKARNCAEATRMAKASIANLTAVLRSRNRSRLRESLGSGGAVGLGSIVYALVVVGDLLNDDSIVEAASSAGALLTADIIHRDNLFDVVGGAAGACLGLLRLYRKTRSQVFLDQAVLCADHLEISRRAGEVSWSSGQFGHRALSGIAHGAAGYAMAFSRLFGATGVERYRDIAQRCVEFENAYYDDARHNWPDLRCDVEAEKRWWPVQWCYGACGIGAARLSMLRERSLDVETLVHDVRNAAEATLSLTSYSNDTLCCGVAGQADFLMEAGRHFGDPAYLFGSLARIGEIARRWERAGDVSWDLGTKEYNLGLFRGLAGIGYTALRAENSFLPQILTWE